MKEKILAESKVYKPGKAAILFVLCVAVIIASLYPIACARREAARDEWRTAYDAYSASGPWDHEFDEITAACTAASARYEELEYVPDLYFVPSCVSGGFAIIFLLFLLYVTKMRMTVTDKRVYGCTAFGRRVDLPLDSISAVATSFFKGLAVATSSGKIRFLLLKNRDELHNAISTLLIDRQETEREVNASKQEARSSNADELKKFKELLDSGIISQEEFDAKKKQLLGL